MNSVSNRSSLMLADIRIEETLYEQGTKEFINIYIDNKERILTDPNEYYNEAKDRIDIQEYYKEIQQQTPVMGKELFFLLSNLIKHTHTNHLTYPISRNKYLYTWVDIQPDGNLKNIYSGESRNPQNIIQEDFQTFRKRREIFIRSYQSSCIRDLNFFSGYDQLKYNTEHVVPQLWYNEREPKRGDLFHLFTCDPKYTSKRSYYPYPDLQCIHQELTPEPVQNDCGIVKDMQFQPKYGKGLVARAMLYFLLRYPFSIDKNWLEKIDIPSLIHWHHRFPVTLHERHRNQAIYKIQGNRNPFIDFPNLVTKLSLQNLINYIEISV